MIHYCDTIKDVMGNNFIAIKFSNSYLDKFILDFIEHLGNESDIYIKNQQKRDGYMYHLTVINVSEFNMLCKKEGYDNFIKSLNGLFTYEIDDLKLLGIGKASKNENTAYCL